ncbi:MAG: ComEC/Rec2 family competence protein, partial [Hyphomicrobiaceae bacterium]|nr:ComEC/Rec2 family competence protein [Hyphomicrobiaceae bacterium]
AAVERVRQAIGQRIMAVLPGQPGAIANALITGERGGISEETNAAFRASGLFHVLSISGLHMVIMSGSMFFLVRLCLAAVPALALRYPIKKWAAVAATVAAFAYLLISGASFATVRSVIMISIMFLAVVLDRPALALRNVVLAALVILILFPESLFNTGFQMSFAAVAGLVAFYEVIRHRGEGAFVPRRPLTRLALFLVGIVLSTLVANAAVAPFAAYHFHQSQQYAVLANLIAIPLCNLIVMPAALVTLMAMPLGLEALPLWIMGLGIEGMTWVAARVGSLPGAVGRIPAMPTFAFLLMVAGGLWLVLWQTRWRLLGAALIAAGIALAPTLQRPDVLIARDGGLVAVRSDDQQLSAVGSRRPSFELIRWLEHDGDTRE